MFYIVKKDGKIIADESKSTLQFTISFLPDVSNNTEIKEGNIVKNYKGEWELSEQETLPPNEWTKEQRAKQYSLIIDPITNHINRLKDEEQTDDIVAKIEELQLERNRKYLEIKAEYPYIEERMLTPEVQTD